MQHSIWEQILGLIIAAFFIWMLHGYIRTNPKMLSAAKLGKSFWSMGILGLILLALVGFIIVLLNS